MVAVGLWYGQVYVMDNEHRWILLMAFWMILWRDPEPHCCAIHPRPSPHVAALKCTAPCCKDLYTIPGSWKHPSSCMASILIGHVTYWACLGCSGLAYTTACSSSCQYPVTSHSHWIRVDQHSTDHNQQPDQLYAKEKCWTAWGKWWSHQILTGFRTPPQNTVKLHILEWPFKINKI